MWHNVKDQLPELQKNEFDDFQSDVVLVCGKYLKIMTAYCRQYEDEDVYHWYTDCSEGWEITDSVEHWMPLPPLPEN